MLHRTLEQELSAELAVIRQRQATRLGREMERIDDYFERYERELTARARRSRAASTRTTASPLRRPNTPDIARPGCAP